jgi:type IV pilus assembly protein PilF
MKRWFWPLWAVGLVLSALVGCAGAPPAGGAPGVGSGGAKDYVTDFDEPESRKRARIRLELASGYFEQGKATVALDEVKQSLAADPNFAAAYNLRGLIFMQLNEPKLAESSFQQALRLDERDGDIWHNIGWMHCQAARYADAAKAFEAALKVPNYPAAQRTWMALGVCQARAGRVLEAERSLTRAFELDASNPFVMFNLASLLYQRGEHSRAQFYVRRLNNSELANAESLWLGARIENKLNNREAVRQLGDQLTRRFGQSREADAYLRGAFNE